MKYTMDDICLTWNEYPTYIFIPTLIGPPNSCVFKFSNCSDAVEENIFSSPFWDIHKVTSRGLTKEAGFIFLAKGSIFRLTDKSIASLNNSDNSKEVIAIMDRTKPWSSNGLDLIRYEYSGEVITDLCTIMGVDVTTRTSEEG